MVREMYAINSWQIKSVRTTISKAIMPSTKVNKHTVVV
jgi:hypothetical protein